MLGGAGAAVGDGDVGAIAAEEGLAGAVVDPVTGPASGAAAGLPAGANGLEGTADGAVEGPPAAGGPSFAEAGVSRWVDSGGCGDCTEGCARTDDLAADVPGGVPESVLLSNLGGAPPCGDPVGSE